MKALAIIAMAFAMSGCTDAVWDYSISAYGENFDVECFSGGQSIFKSKTTGKVASLDGGGWAFRTADGRFVQTFADCFVSFEK